MGDMLVIRAFAFVLTATGYRLAFRLAVKHYERGETLWRRDQNRPGVPGLGYARVEATPLPRSSRE